MKDLQFDLDTYDEEGSGEYGEPIHKCNITVDGLAYIDLGPQPGSPSVVIERRKDKWVLVVTCTDGDDAIALVHVMDDNRVVVVPNYRGAPVELLPG